MYIPTAGGNEISIRNVYSDVADAIPEIGQEVFTAAQMGEASSELHARLVSEVRVLTTLEQSNPHSLPRRRAPNGKFRFGAWNLERCKYAEQSSIVAQKAGCDVLFATEVDVGMARSGNLHTPKELALRLGAQYTFATEFVEVGVGNEFEELIFSGRRNRTGLHGNAIISSVPLLDSHLIWLEEDGGSWFALDWHHRRIGGRNAIFGRMEVNGYEIGVAVVHLESLPPAEGRSLQVERLLHTIDRLFDGPVIVGGDFNTSQLPPALGGDNSPDWFRDPSQYEPLFSHFRRAGYEWVGANTSEHTRRSIPTGFVKPPFRRSDWFFVRGLEASNPQVWPAVGPGGVALSDHELITVDISMP